jgi:phosphoribosylformimino-5-aminoimidazole carboxamide ribotide isomerase
MIVIPAIDLRGGRCVRLIQGDVRDETVYSSEPASVAKLWKLKGAKMIHVVDLDGAITGTPKNLKHLYEIVKQVNVPIQFGGGVRDLDTLKAVINHGVKRVILGTSAAQDKKFLEKAVDKFGKQVVVGIDARDGKVAVKGWKETSKLMAVDMAREMEAMGVRTLIFTDIRKDGMLTGPNFKQIKELARAVKIPVIASGGVSSLKDIRHLLDLEQYGVEACIVGKAIYTGKMELKEAIQVASGAKEVSVKRSKAKPKKKA